MKPLYIALASVVVLGGGGATAFYITKKKESKSAITTPRQVAKQDVSSTSTETCSPPNTATCGPDGNPVGGSNVATNGGKLSASSDVKKITADIGLQKIQLTGAGPQGLDVDAKTGLVYVANNGNIISGCQGDVTKLGNKPSAIVKGSSTLSIVDPTAAKETANVATESAPVWPYVDAGRNVVYVAGSGSGKVALHELGTGKKSSTIDVGGKPHAFGLSDSGVLVVSNTHDSSQTYMTALNADTQKILGHHKVPEYPHGIGLDEDKNVFYMVGVKDGKIAIIDAKTGEVKSQFAGTEGFGNSNMLVFSSKLRRIFVADTKQTSSITAVDPDNQKILSSFGFSQTSSPAWGMAIDDANGLIYAALPNSNAVGIADMKSMKPLATIEVDECPYAVKLDLDRGLGFTANQVNATVSVFDLKKVTNQVLGK